MAARKIRVMISSRNNDMIPYEGRKQKLSAVRLALKESIESVELFGDPLFEVWINEDAPAAEGTEDAWEHCISQVKKADIVLALYNGNAGWARHEGEVGICHGELQAALDTAPAKLRIIELKPYTDGDSHERDARFRDYVRVQSRFWASAGTGEEVIAECHHALREAVADMVRLGVREARKGKYYTGAALDWSRLDYQARKAVLENTLRDALVERDGSLSDEGVILKLGSEQVLFLCHGVPAALSVAPARELVGRPHLRDHEYDDALQSASGPAHIIACHRGVTENQAVGILGFPDATIVTTPFGVYVADAVQKIQLVFIRDCRDETGTRVGVQRFFEWLAQSREDRQLAARAAARRRIVQAIAKEAPERV